MKVEAWFDGCIEPINPGGHGAYGVLVKIDGTVSLSEGRYIGHGKAVSSNVAEYSGVIAAIEHIILLQLDGPLTSVVIYGDSQLVIKQLSGAWAARVGLYIPLFKKAQLLLSYIKTRNLGLVWIPREHNDECDFLSKQVLREMGVTFQLQKE